MEPLLPSPQLCVVAMKLLLPLPARSHPSLIFILLTHCHGPSLHVQMVKRDGGTFPGPTGKENCRFVLMFLKRGSQKNKRSREVLALTTSALLLAVVVLCTQRDSLGKSVESSLPLTFWSFFLALPYQEPFPCPWWQVPSSASVDTLHATDLCHRADAVSPFCVFPVC